VLGGSEPVKQRVALFQRERRGVFDTL
jgi:hypothetical protein